MQSAMEFPRCTRMNPWHSQLNPSFFKHFALPQICIGEKKSNNELHAQRSPDLTCLSDPTTLQPTTMGTFFDGTQVSNSAALKSVHKYK